MEAYKEADNTVLEEEGRGDGKSSPWEMDKNGLKYNEIRVI